MPCGIYEEDSPGFPRGQVPEAPKANSVCLSTPPRKAWILRLPPTTCPRFQDRGPPCRWLTFDDILPSCVPVFIFLFAACERKFAHFLHTRTRDSPPLPLTASRIPLRVMSDLVLAKWAESLSRMALKRAREASADAHITSQANRTAVVARLAIPGSKDLVRNMGTRNLTIATSAAASMPFLSDMTRHLRRTVFEPWRADLNHLEGGDGRHWRDVLVKAHLFARPSLIR